MDTASKARAADTELIRRLDAEWRVLTQSRSMQERLRMWASSDRRLDFVDGQQLVAAAQRRNATSWAARDQVLAALSSEPPTMRWRDGWRCRSCFLG